MNISAAALPSSFDRFIQNVEADKQCCAILFDFKQSHAMNTNLVAFLLWFAAEQYGRINKKELNVLLQVIAHWHERIVLPLRRAALMSQAAENSIKESVSYEAQFANEIEQQFLKEALVLRARPRTTAQRLADACYNFSLYCKQLKLHLDAQLKAQSCYLLQFVFPSMTESAIKKANDHALQTIMGGTELGAQLSLSEL